MRLTSTPTTGSDSREGYDTTALPLAPDPALDLPYLRQILSDHADMCSSHFNRGATGCIVPSATRKPIVYGAAGASS